MGEISLIFLNFLSNAFVKVLLIIQKSENHLIQQLRIKTTNHQISKQNYWEIRRKGNTIRSEF